jgi:hypothetical protein
MSVETTTRRLPGHSAVNSENSFPVRRSKRRPTSARIPAKPAKVQKTRKGQGLDTNNSSHCNIFQHEPNRTYLTTNSVLPQVTVGFELFSSSSQALILLFLRFVVHAEMAVSCFHAWEQR